jgi:hypothetical protein
MKDAQPVANRYPAGNVFNAQKKIRGQGSAPLFPEPPVERVCMQLKHSSISKIFLFCLPADSTG